MTLSLNLGKPEELLARVLPNGRLGGLVLDGKAPWPLGTKADLTVSFSEPVERHFTVSVQLAWVRHRGSEALNLKERYGVDFLPEDAARRERLLAYARQEVATEMSRYEPRVATDLSVSIRHEGRLRKESLFDLSPGGAFIRTGMFVPVGALLEFAVRPPRSLRRIHLKGRVAWVRKTGPTRGFGVEFVYTDARQQARVRQLFERLTRSAPDLAAR